MNKCCPKNLPCKAAWLHRLKEWWMSPYSFQFVVQVRETRITFQHCGYGQLMSLTLKKRLVPYSCHTEHHIFLSLCFKFYSISFTWDFLVIDSPKTRKTPLFLVLYFWLSSHMLHTHFPLFLVTSNNPLILFRYLYPFHVPVL